jgi:FtsZ-binding cell division protein ZapB
VKNVSLQNSLEELKTTHENLKISHETLNTSWGTLKEKNEELKEAHNSLLALEVKGKMSMGVECNLLNILLTHFIYAFYPSHLLGKGLKYD